MSRLLARDAAAGGLAFINSLGSLGGVVAPNVLAYAHQTSGSFSGSLWALAGFSLVTAVLAALLKTLPRTKDQGAQTA